MNILYIRNKKKKNNIMKKQTHVKVFEDFAEESKPIHRTDLAGKPYEQGRIGYSALPRLEVKHAVEFAPSGTFGAITNAESYLKELGYNTGSMEGPNPIGFSNHFEYISKWGNMRSEEHEQLDGAIIPNPSFRDGGNIILFFTEPKY